MASQKGRSQRPSHVLARVWPEPCTTPMGTCIGMTMLGSALVAPQLAGWSLGDTSWEILAHGCRSKAGSHAVIPDDKKLAQE